MEPSPTSARIEELLAHADWVRALARNLSRDDADADDLAQETWLAALRRPPSDLRRAWLGGVLRNLSRMRWRTTARRARREETAAGTRSGPPAPDDVVARMEMHRLLADAVLRLDEPWRSTVVLRYLDGLTSAEIARLEGIPAATVRGRLKAALERLRADLDRRHDGRREAWLAGLVPVLGLSAAEARRLVAPAAPASAAAPAAVWVAGLLLLFVGGGLMVLGPREKSGGPPPPAPAGEEPAPEPERLLPPDVAAEPEPAEEDGDPTPAAPAPRRATPTEHARADTPPGMVHVPAGTAVIGTTWERLRELLQGRDERVRRDFAFEAPQHRVQVDGFFLDRYEVTNAQYLAFLRDTAVAAYDTDQASLADLEEVAGTLTGLAPDRWKRDDVAWRQLYRAHRDALHRAMPDVVVRDDAGAIDEQATEEAFRHAPLVRGLVLRFWSRKPPETWPTTEPRPDRLDHPVTSVSYDDAEAFAEWAGKHVPTEQEWEYAARGPEGFFYPWGDAWFADTSHVNWGGWVKDEDQEPRTMRVDTLADGRSWCGVHHLLGNAGEWTSSWFGPYPGNEREHVSMGEYVKVIRGATFVDSELLVLRSAARNFIGGGIKAPPRPGNRFEYVGFRCAAYAEPGRDRLEAVVRRAARGRRTARADLDPGAWAAAATEDFAPAGAPVENHVYVLGRSHAIVLIPFRTLEVAGARGRDVRSRRDLLRASERRADPIPLAVLHTDVGLRRLLPVEGGSGERKAPPGTYVLALFKGRLCLALPSLDLVGFLSRGPATSGELDVGPIDVESAPRARIDLDAGADAVFLGLGIPWAGDGRTGAVLGTVALTTEAGALRRTGDWRTTR